MDLSSHDKDDIQFGFVNSKSQGVKRIQNFQVGYGSKKVKVQIYRADINRNFVCLNRVLFLYTFFRRKSIIINKYFCIKVNALCIEI